MEKSKIPPWIKQLREKELQEFLNSEQPAIKEFARWMLEPDRVIALQLEVERLATENMRLRTVMLEAHDEIVGHWDSHCDESGAGPVNLIRRLEDGSGYYPGQLHRVQGRYSTSSADADGG